MEHEMDAHLNDWEPDTWTPWEADEEMLHDILTGQLVPPVEVMVDEMETLPHFYCAA